MYPDSMTVNSETCEHQKYHWNVYVFQGIKARQGKKCGLKEGPLDTSTYIS